MYKRQDLPLPSLPLSPYALEKANNERYADLYARLFGIPSLGLRYFNVYGVRQDPSSPYSGVISKFVSAFLQNKSVKIFGDGRQSRDFISVKDVARANLLALESDKQGAMNIATGLAETLLDLVNYIEIAGNRSLAVEFLTARSGDILQSYAKTDRAKMQLGFCYEERLAQGIKELVID